MTSALEACPCCRGRELAEGPKAPSFAYTVCRTCGSAFQASAELDHDAYYEDYFPAQVQSMPPILEKRYAAVLEQMERQLTGRQSTERQSAGRRLTGRQSAGHESTGGHVTGLRLLEVGCGNGHFLMVARERGWSVAGVELSRAQVDHCREHGLDVVYGDLVRDGLFEGRSFDAAVAIEVFEHVTGPGALVAAMTSRLDTGGLLYMTTPNYGSLVRRVLGARWSVLNAEHVTLASPRGMKDLLARAGAPRARVFSRNINVGELRSGLRRTSHDERALHEAVHERVRSGEELRDRIEGSRVLRLAKRTLNLGLGATGLGDTLVCWGVREGNR